LTRRALVATSLLLAVPALFSAPITFSGGYTRMQMAEGARQIVLSGGADVSADSLQLHADTISLRGDDYGLVTCSGNVTVTDDTQGLTVTSPAIAYDRTRKQITIHSWVEITDMQNRVGASAGNLLFDMEEGTMELESHVRLVRTTERGTMVCRADRVLFDRDGQKLSLSGTATVQWDGDTYQAHAITVNLDTEEITMDGSIKGTVHG